MLTEQSLKDALVEIGKQYQPRLAVMEINQKLESVLLGIEDKLRVATNVTERRKVINGLTTQEKTAQREFSRLSVDWILSFGDN